MSTVLNIQGTSPGPYYVMDNSQTQGARVCGVYGTLHDAQRSMLNTANALAFDDGAPYVPPVQGEA